MTPTPTPTINGLRLVSPEEAGYKKENRSGQIVRSVLLRNEEPHLCFYGDDNNPSLETFLLIPLPKPRTTRPFKRGEVNRTRSIEALMNRVGIQPGKPIRFPYPNMAEYQQRVVIEKFELDEKLEKLAAFRETLKFKAIIPQEQKRLTDQLQVMREYSHILAERILHFIND